MLNDLTLVENLIQFSDSQMCILNSELDVLVANSELRNYLDKIDRVTLRRKIDACGSFPCSIKMTVLIEGQTNDEVISILRIDDSYVLKMQRFGEGRLRNRRCSTEYDALFEYTPVPIWEEDLSEVKNEIDKLKAKGVKDFRDYFEQNPQEVTRVASHLIVNDVNQAVIDLNEAGSKAYLLENFWKLIDQKSATYAINQFEAIANGELTCEFDAELKTFAGNTRYVRFKWKVVSGHEEDYGKVFLITTDLTERIVKENVSLQNSIREKEVLLKEVHHRVKNNLQIISSLLNLQLRNISEPGTKELFEVSLGRIHSMATVHELLYRSKDISHININDYVHKLVNPLIDALKGATPVSVNMNIDNVALHINTAIPLGLVINEIITNSLIHAIPDVAEGLIYINLNQNGSVFKLEIGDNGKGIKDSDYDRDTLGLQLIPSLVEQLSGTIELRKELPGAHYVIHFEDQGTIK